MGLKWRMFVVRQNSFTGKGIKEIKIIPIGIPAQESAAERDLKVRYPYDLIEKYTIDGGTDIQIDKFI